LDETASRLAPAEPGRSRVPPIVVEEGTLLSDLARACLPTEYLKAGLTKRRQNNTVVA
jgi:hypothetical protein